MRDRDGVVQVCFDPKYQEALTAASGLRNEFCIQIKGEVIARPDNQINKNMATGEVEVLAKELRIYNASDVLPLDFNQNNTEEQRLKYRYLDLRRPEMAQRLKTRAKITSFVRRFMDDNGFLDIETPMPVSYTHLRERVNNRRNRRNANEEVTSESAVNFANVSDDNRQEEKAEKPVAERRQRRDLRKRVRIDDNANNANENVVETVEVPAIKNEVVENNAVDNTEDKPRQERQRRTPRHLRASNNQRRRRNEVKSPMPLFAAVASPELASGKVCIDYSAVNAPKENNFLSVDELLEQEKTKKGVITPATGIVVEEKSVEAQPALDFITQPANEAVQQKMCIRDRN